MSMSLEKQRFSKPEPMMQDLVSPQKRLNVPNHILDTKIFNKLSQNSITKVQPSVVHFAGYKLHKTRTTMIKICNASAERQNLHIISPSTKYFKIQYTKPTRFVPGFTINVLVSFTADEWRYYYDCIRIHCKGEENLIVPLHAFPVMDISHFPKKLVFPPNTTTLGETSIKRLPLYSRCPVDYEFQVTVCQSHPAFNIHPLSGIVPGEGRTDLEVTFTPTEYITAHMTVQLAISQFNSEPMTCNITASCSPSKPVQFSKSVKDLDQIYKQSMAIDSNSFTPSILPRKGLAAQKRRLPGLPLKKDFELDGLQFPMRINTQHAVNNVLIQQKGKLRVKDLREAVLFSNIDSLKSSTSLVSVNSTRQMKEADFEKIVRQDTIGERANQLRWQVHLGQDPMTNKTKRDVLNYRKLAQTNYKYTKLKDPQPQTELQAPLPEKYFRRSRRIANTTSKFTPTFDMYKNNPWTVRHRALYRFQQAARTILIRARADKKVVMLRKMIEEFKSGFISDNLPVVKSSETLPTGMSPFQVEAHDQHDDGTINSDPSDLISNFVPTKVKPFTFPVYVSPDTKDDIAPDALGEVPIDPTDVLAKRDVPFNGLVVPQYYQLAGYKRYDIAEVLKNYVPPGWARKLKTGAEDEIIHVTLPSQITQHKKDLAYMDDSKSGRKSEITAFPDKEQTEDLPASGLIPPTGLFRNPLPHRLHIFNRIPGLQRNYLPLPQSEVDLDYHLCPIPQYTQLSQEKNYLDRMDVIKGVMAWKKFSSHGINSFSKNLTLTDVWLPRWSDCFSQAMVPSFTPTFLNELSLDDQSNILSDEDTMQPSFPMLTPEMVNSQFQMEKELKEEAEKLNIDEETKQEISIANQASSESIGISIMGPISRVERQEELELYTHNQFDILGEQIRERHKKLYFN